MRLWHLTTSEGFAVGPVIGNMPRNKHFFIYIWIIEESSNLSVNGRQVEQTESTWETSSQKEYFLRKTESHPPCSNHHVKGLQSPLGTWETGVELIIAAPGPKGNSHMQKGGGAGPITDRGTDSLRLWKWTAPSWGWNRAVSQETAAKTGNYPILSLVVVVEGGGCFVVFLCVCFFCRLYIVWSSKLWWKSSTWAGHSHLWSTLLLVGQNGIREIKLDKMIWDKGWKTRKIQRRVYS